jgi:hypothetical protein
MAKINQGFLGGFSGKLGTAIGACNNGTAYIYALPLKRKKSNTPAQMLQRKKFGFANKLLRPLSDYLQRGFISTSSNRFAAAVKHCLDNNVQGDKPENVTVDFSKLCVSRGSLENVQNPQISMSTLKVSFLWDTSVGADGTENDVVMPLVYNKTKQRAIYDLNNYKRADGKAELSLLNDWAGDELCFYIATFNGKSNASSDSFYLGVQYA